MIRLPPPFGRMACLGMGFWLAACTAPTPPPKVIPEPPPTPAEKTGTRKPYTLFGKRYEPLDSAYGYREKGIASWYGHPFHGRKTANGETYDMHALTAAHTLLPMDTTLQVTNLDNGRQVVVRVNDRGPFVKNRLIDLSYVAAKKLDMLGTGTAPVLVQTITAPETTEEDSEQATGNVTQVAVPNEPHIFIQMGAFANLDNASKLATKLARSAETDIQGVPQGQKSLWRVRVGPMGSVAEAERVGRKLEELGFSPGRIIIE